MEEKVTFGLERKIAYLIIWLTSWLGGLIFFISEKEDRGIRKASMQSIILGVALTVVNFGAGILTWIPILGAIFSIIRWIVGIVYLVSVIYLAVTSYQGNEVHLPVIGDLAEKYI